jgi:hypothetical protein
VKFIRVGVDYPDQGGQKEKILFEEIRFGFEKSQKQKKGKD